MASKRPRRMRRQGAAAAAALAFALALSAPCAEAQSPATGFSGIGGNNAKKPINIESDKLEVDDKRHIAIFSGNVTATQGEYNLHAQRLEVSYEKEQQASGQDPAAPQRPRQAKAANDAASDPISSGQIKLIHATGGKVVVISKRDEQEVSGDDAVYDVKAQKIVMTGKEVILTQKKNVVKGSQLNIDLATGRATVVPGHALFPPGSPPEQGKGRVQAIFSQDGGKGAVSFNPFGAQKEKDSTPAKQAPKPANQSWRPRSE